MNESMCSGHGMESSAMARTGGVSEFTSCHVVHRKIESHLDRQPGQSLLFCLMPFDA